jgi:hypothetical protein
MTTTTAPRNGQVPTGQLPTETTPLSAPVSIPKPVKQYSRKALAAAIILSGVIAMFGAVLLSSTVFSHTGPTGPRGAVGAQGLTGHIGKKGPQGRAGVAGQVGQAGANGVNGANGTSVAVPVPVSSFSTDAQGFAFGVNSAGHSCSNNPEVGLPICF